MASDQKKRTLEALERRFALAKTEVEQEQNRKRPHHQQQTMENTSKSTQLPKEDTFTTPLTKKAHVFFIGSTPRGKSSGKLDARNNKTKKDVEAHDPAYSQIWQPVHENLLNAGGVKLSSNQMVDDILHELFQNGDYAEHYMKGLQNKKMENWFLLDSVVQGRGASAVAQIKDSKSHAKRCRRHMSMKEHRKYGSFDLPQEFHKFEIFGPMHEMWKDYILKLTKNLGDAQKIAQRLLSADLHGAILQVAVCKVSSFSGVSGIMVRETAETFGIITRENKFRVVPKRASVFIMRADCWKITLHGDELTARRHCS